MNITLEQHNDLARLINNNILFFITGRQSYESDVEPSDLDILINIKDKQVVDTLFEPNLKREASMKQHNKDVKDNRIFYKNNLDVLYIDNQSNWEGYQCFARMIDGFWVTHPAQSMLAKLDFITQDVIPAVTNRKHINDLRDYISRQLNIPQP